MAGGLIALLDDVATLAKLTAASLDDVAGYTAKASAKSAAVVIDDTAVTPRYVVGLSTDRELPMIARIARGSLRNKLVYLLPIALLLAAFAAWAITPLLMAGGVYLACEGAEKVREWLGLGDGGHAAESGPDAGDPEAIEDAAVASAVRTDFVLSAEIMTIALAAIPDGGFLERAVALALAGVLITLGVYGAVALIVRADDVGAALARGARPTPVGRLLGRIGRALVRGMPGFLEALAVAGTLAMTWVGGGILVHGLERFGVAAPAHAIAAAAVAVSDAVPLLPGLAGWLVEAVASGLVGLAVGLVALPVVGWGRAVAAGVRGWWRNRSG